MNLLVHKTILLIHFHFFNTENGGTNQERKDEG